MISLGETSPRELFRIVGRLSESVAQAEREDGDDGEGDEDVDHDRAFGSVSTTLPGFMMPSGSSAALILRMRSSSTLLL